jgi:hypothetical protein
LNLVLNVISPYLSLVDIFSSPFDHQTIRMI